MEQELQEVVRHSSLFPLLFVVLALLCGAALRYVLRKGPLPYTVSLLFLGLLAGASYRLGLVDGLEFMADSIAWAASIDPQLILYLFLPTLVFQAAYAMDVHIFRKSLANASLLALPGLIIALLLTALLLMGMQQAGLGFAGWGWTMALLFGTVISATDPVAVVAILRELGAGKKLATLIEGESLLNDATAIVIFSVLLLLITGGEAPDGPIVEFFRVSLGGMLLGLAAGWLSTWWLGRVFNDSLVETSLIVAMAYGSYFIAESFLEVSGILALVTMGLILAGKGRTRISPEVSGFLKGFWELAAFMANTLIFIIVGILIASRVNFQARDLLILVLVYVGLMLVRALMLVLFYPLMKKLGYGLQKKDALVLWYGALRGAVGLALALLVSAEPAIDPHIGEAFLFYTAGIVTLTLLINASSMKWIVRKLGLAKVSAPKAIMMEQAREYLHEKARSNLDLLMHDRYLKRARWGKVKSYLPGHPSPEKPGAIEGRGGLSEIRRRLLEKEKGDYWQQFNEGMSGSQAVLRLSDSIDRILDEEGSISLSARPDLEQEWTMPGLLEFMQSVPVLGKLVRRYYFDRLAISYDLARSFVKAQEACLVLLDEIWEELGDNEALISRDEYELLGMEIDENRIQGHSYLRNLRNSYPEIYTAISTRQATRALLNRERQHIGELLQQGVLEADESSRMLHEVESRMKQVLHSAPDFHLPGSSALLEEISWLLDLQDSTLRKIRSAFQSKVYAVGHTLIRENGKPDGIFVLVRGKVKIVRNGKVLEVVGSGNVVGEMAVLTNKTRMASVVALTPVSVLWLSQGRLKRILREDQELEKRLWEFATTRFDMNRQGENESFGLREDGGSNEPA